MCVHGWAWALWDMVMEQVFLGAVGRPVQKGFQPLVESAAPDLWFSRILTLQLWDPNLERPPSPAGMDARMSLRFVASGLCYS